MRRRETEKLLKDELDRFAPSDFEEVKRRAIPRNATDEGIENGGGTRVLRLKAAPFALCSVAIAATLLLVWIFSALLPFAPKDLSEPKVGGTFFIDVNPSIEVRYDQDGNVISARGLNDDGRVLISGLSPAGEDAETFVSQVFSRCVSQGYFVAGRDSNAVLVTAETENGVSDEEKTAQLKALFCGEFAKNKIRGVVITGVTDSATEEAAERYGIDGQKLSLIRYYLNLGGVLAEDKYATVTIRELYEMIEEKQEEEEDVLEDLCESLFKGAEASLDLLEIGVKSAVRFIADKKEYEDLLDDVEDAFEDFSDLWEDVEDGKESGGVQRVTAALSALSARLKRDGFTELSAKTDELQEDIERIFNKIEGYVERLKELLDFETRREEKERENADNAAKGEEEDFDYEAWQAAHEEAFRKNWYDIRGKGG